MENKTNIEKLLFTRKEINNKINAELKERFSYSQIVILLILNKYNEILEEDFLLKDYLKINKKLKKENKITMTVSFYSIDFRNRSVQIKGADPYLNFIVSKYDMEKLKYYYDRNYENILAKVTIRKHKEENLFIEQVSIIEENEEELCKALLDLRKEMSINEWKNLLLNSLGYNLNDSKSILKDLMLIRVVPYVEKNYSYIELGPYSTGKTSFSEIFETGEKISTNISMAQLYYNVKEKREGILFSKNVLYLDESDFSDLGTEEAKILLQVLGGNKLNVRDNSISKSTEVSIVSQGNVIKGIEEYLDETIFDRFNKSFNSGAFLDRANFFVAGWLIPIYENIKSDEEEVILPNTILEKILKKLRNENKYKKLIDDNYDIILTTTNMYQGRFIKTIKSTISGLLKLLYLGDDVNLEIDKEEIEKIIILSIYGKLSIYNIFAKDREAKVCIYYRGEKIKEITIKEMLNNYIISKEKIYFERNNLKTAQDITGPSKIYWENDESDPKKINRLLRKYKKEKITEFPKEYENIFLYLNDIKVKERYFEFYKIVVTYNNEIRKSKEDRKEFEYAYAAIIKLFLELSKFKIDERIKEFIKKLMELVEKNFDMNVINMLFFGKKVEQEENEHYFWKEIRRIKNLIYGNFSRNNETFIDKDILLEQIKELHILEEFKAIPGGGDITFFKVEKNTKTLHELLMESN